MSSKYSYRGEKIQLTSFAVMNMFHEVKAPMPCNNMMNMTMLSLLMGKSESKKLHLLIKSSG